MSCLAWDAPLRNPDTSIPSVAISDMSVIDRATGVAPYQRHAFSFPIAEEVVRYALHGVLHLLGHDDLQPNARRFMKRAENRLVAAVAKTHPLAQLRRQRRS